MRVLPILLGCKMVQDGTLLEHVENIGLTPLLLPPSSLFTRQLMALSHFLISFLDLSVVFCRHT